MLMVMSLADPDFHMTVQNGPAGTEIVMSGSISERTTFDLGQPPAPQVFIDASGVQRINSMGVSAWIRFVNGLGKQGIQVTVRRLSAALVSQASMISSFLGGATLESIMAPYYCPECENAVDQPFGANDEIPASIPCPKCNAEMEFDDNMEAFLAFRQ
jgi:hypothetical protein